MIIEWTTTHEAEITDEELDNMVKQLEAKGGYDFNDAIWLVSDLVASWDDDLWCVWSAKETNKVLHEIMRRMGYTGKHCKITMTRKDMT